MIRIVKRTATSLLACTYLNDHAFVAPYFSWAEFPDSFEGSKGCFHFLKKMFKDLTEDACNVLRNVCLQDGVSCLTLIKRIT